MSWVEARPDLEWRWIQWIQVIWFGCCLPFIIFAIPETREGVILRRQAARKRKSGDATGTFMARSEVNKPKMVELIKASSLRPICKSKARQVTLV